LSALTFRRHLSTTAVGEGREAWRMRGVTISYHQQKAASPGIKEAMPEDAGVNAQVLQDVVLRVDRAFQAFFPRRREGRTPGYPRFHGHDRCASFTSARVGDHGGARLDAGFLVRSKIGRIAARWSLGDRGQSCIHEPDVFWLRYYDRQGLVRPLARLPGMRNEPVSRP
jgi:hypothetical protein